MEFIKSACYFIAVLSALIIAHEWGHYMVAKMCGMRVDDFSLFFGKKVICLGRRNGTEYNIRLIPLGGFVKIAGMEPEELGAQILPPHRFVARKANSPLLAGLSGDALAQVDPEKITDGVATAVENAIGDNNRLTVSGAADLQALLSSTALTTDETAYLKLVLDTRGFIPDADGYNQKPLWQRSLTILAGPAVSLIFGYVILCVMGFTTGLPTGDLVEPVVASVTSTNSPAAKAGMRAGDRILMIDDAKIVNGVAMVKIIHNSIGKSLHLTVVRSGKVLTMDVTPASAKGQELKNGKLVDTVEGRIGIAPEARPIFTTLGVKDSIIQGTLITRAEIEGIIELFVRHRSSEMKESVGGIVGIVDQIHEDSKVGPKQVLLHGAVLSLSLGILNLLPIPILDGGHLLMLAIEGVRRRKLSLRAVYNLQMVGISIIGVLFVLVMYNDIMRLLKK